MSPLNDLYKNLVTKIKVYVIIYGKKKEKTEFPVYFIISKEGNTLINKIITAFIFKPLYFKYPDIIF